MPIIMFVFTHYWILELNENVPVLLDVVYVVLTGEIVL